MTLVLSRVFVVVNEALFNDGNGVTSHSVKTKADSESKGVDLLRLKNDDRQTII